METCNHGINTLFEQLGLPSSDNDIDHFIATHKPLPSQQRLDQASYWSPTQAAFLREALAADSDWSEAVDELNVRLHS